MYNERPFRIEKSFALDVPLIDRTNIGVAIMNVDIIEENYIKILLSVPVTVIWAFNRITTSQYVVFETADKSEYAIWTHLMCAVIMYHDFMYGVSTILLVPRKMHILYCMGSKCCLKFQRATLKFRTKYIFNWLLFYFVICDINSGPSWTYCYFG